MSGFRENLNGRRFGRLIAIRQVSSNKWECRCDCGNVKRLYTSNITRIRGATRSCGCLLKEFNLHSKTVHGMSHTPEHTAWSAAKARCFNPKEPKFKYYGARGIRMFSEWKHDFIAFLAHVGKRPSPKHSLDRINNDGHYEPGNVRWATVLEQRHNRRDHV